MGGRPFAGSATSLPGNNQNQHAPRKSGGNCLPKRTKADDRKPPGKPLGQNQIAANNRAFTSATTQGIKTPAFLCIPTQTGHRLRVETGHPFPGIRWVGVLFWFWIPCYLGGVSTDNAHSPTWENVSCSVLSTQGFCVRRKRRAGHRSCLRRDCCCTAFYRDRP